MRSFPARQRAIVGLLVSSGLLGGSLGGSTAASAQDARQSFSVSGTVAQAYDDDAPLNVAGLIDPTGLNVGGFSTIASGTAAYTGRAGRVRTSVNAASSVRYYSEFGQLRAAGQSASAVVSVPFTRHTSLSAGQSLSYAPSYLSGLFPHGAPTDPGDLQPVPPDYFLNDFASVSSGTSVTLSQAFARSTTLVVTGHLDRTNFVEGSGQRDLQTYGVDGRFSHGLSRNASLTGAYTYRNGDFGYGGSVGLQPDPEPGPSSPINESSEHTVSVGLSYSRPLSAVRRLTVGGSFGSSLLTGVSISVPGVVTIATDSRRMLTGEASIGYQLARTWSVRGSYRKGVEYIPGLIQPVLSDSSSVSLSGFITSTLDLSSSFTYLNATPWNGGNVLFDTRTVDTRLRYLPNGSVAPYVEYIYYIYDFREAAQLSPGLPGLVERNGIRAGVTLHVPQMRR